MWQWQSEKYHQDKVLSQLFSGNCPYADSFPRVSKRGSSYCGLVGGVGCWGRVDLEGVQWCGCTPFGSAKQELLAQNFCRALAPMD